MDYKKPKIVPDRERYPHMHDYAEIDYAWVYRMLAILKKWDQTLTHWICVLQETETNDMLEVEDQLQKLLDKIGVWIESLTAAIKNLTDAELAYQRAELGYQQAELRYQQAEEFYQQQEALAQADTVSTIREAAEMLVSLTEYLSKAITEAAPLFTQLFDCIENRLKIHDGLIASAMDEIAALSEQISKSQSEILEYIDDIYSILEDLLIQSTSRIPLTLGTDFDTTYYNGFYSPTGPDTYLYDTVLKTPSHTMHSLKVLFSYDTFNTLNNDRTYHNGTYQAPIFKHSSSIASTPDSWIVSFNFFGDHFSKAEYYYAEAAADLSQIWNMTPTSQRASWTVNYSFGTTGSRYLVTMHSISDGYNTQYYTAYDGLSFGGVINCNLYYYFTYTE